VTCRACLEILVCGGMSIRLFCIGLVSLFCVLEVRAVVVVVVIVVVVAIHSNEESTPPYDRNSVRKSDLWYSTIQRVQPVYPPRHR